MLAIRGQTAASHHAVQMGMQPQILAPGMQHCREADLRAQAFRIGRQLQQGLCGGLKQQIIHYPLIPQRQRMQLLGQRKDDVEVWHRQQPLQTGLHPLRLLSGLAFGTMPIAARVVREQLKLHLFHPDDAKQFIDELYDAYRECCAYVHVSRRQIEERLQLAENGRSLGFETAEQLRKIGRLMFRVYDMALALYFHGYGASMTGDVFVTVLDDLPSWKFHKGKYVKIVSAYYDYKHERNMRKYGEPRPHDAASWPPRRL